MIFAIDVENVGHWSRVCRTPKPIVNKYKASVEANVVDVTQVEANALDVTHLECHNFFKNNDDLPLSNKTFNNKLGVPPS